MSVVARSLKKESGELAQHGERQPSAPGAEFEDGVAARCLQDLGGLPRHHAAVFFFKQKTAYEISECHWSSDVCSSDLHDVFFFSSRRRHTRFLNVMEFRRVLFRSDAHPISSRRRHTNLNVTGVQTCALPI